MLNTKFLHPNILFNCFQLYTSVYICMPLYVYIYIYDIIYLFSYLMPKRASNPHRRVVHKEHP